ncbi:10216_t:CDS:2, partial [Diversispora eburnea]
NNPLLNMAEARRLPVLKLMAPALAKFQPYIGQELPDEYLDKCNILKSMMGGKYAPVPAQNNFVNPAVNINSPDTLRGWLRAKYQRETVGNQQSAIQRLTQEKYQPYDTPDIYEARIRPLLLGVANNDAQVLGFLKSHLT